uniref:Battenin n=1 Tax=Latimeria chalumnae TaxID=7897 RepID=H3A2N1_LATCH
YWRNVVGFWYLLAHKCINFLFLINSLIPYSLPNTSAIPLVPLNENVTHSGRYDCNPFSTAVILLADILPTLAIKLSAPLYIHLLPYSFRVMMCVMSAGASFIIVSFSTSIGMSILGVVFASISSGLGEITFLCLTAYFFHSDVVSGWSSGTGGAGIFGALSYSGLTQVGLSPRHTLQVMLVIPLIMAISYFCALVHPASLPRWTMTVNRASASADRRPLIECNQPPTGGVSSPPLPSQKIFSPPQGLLKYMIPLLLVYFAEYFINQGLLELFYFRNTSLKHSEQYRWYQTLYQLGVFVSRSSVKCLQIRKIWLLALLQGINMVFLLFGVCFLFLPSIYLLFAIILYEGLLGGAAYVNAFNNITQEHSQSPEQHLEFAMGVASISDTLGIALSGAIAIPVHDHFCSL